MDNTEIRSILQTLGERVPPSSRLLLVGGSALILLGSPRRTIDIDFVGDDVSPSEVDQILIQAAKELKLYVEPVPMEVFVADPYVIAFSKLDRAFDTDYDDLIFLIRHNLVELDQLEQITRNSLSRAREFDMNPDDLLAHLQELKHRLK